MPVFFFLNAAAPLRDDSFRGEPMAAATSKMERFVIIVNDWKLLTIIIKRSTLNVAAVLHLPLSLLFTTKFSGVPGTHLIELGRIKR